LEALENLTGVFRMFGFGSTVDHDVVKVGRAELVEVLAERVVYNVLKLYWGSGQPKRHD
jgi:hypothetical protein